MIPWKGFLDPPADYVRIYGLDERNCISCVGLVKAMVTRRAQHDGKYGLGLVTQLVAMCTGRPMPHIVTDITVSHSLECSNKVPRRYFSSQQHIHLILL